MKYPAIFLHQRYNHHVTSSQSVLMKTSATWSKRWQHYFHLNCFAESWFSTKNLPWWPMMYNNIYVLVISHSQGMWPGYNTNFLRACSAWGGRDYNQTRVGRGYKCFISHCCVLLWWLIQEMAQKRWRLLHNCTPQTLGSALRYSVHISLHQREGITYLKYCILSFKYYAILHEEDVHVEQSTNIIGNHIAMGKIYTYIYIFATVALEMHYGNTIGQGSKLPGIIVLQSTLNWVIYHKIWKNGIILTFTHVSCTFLFHQLACLSSLSPGPCEYLLHYTSTASGRTLSTKPGRTLLCHRHRYGSTTLRWQSVFGRTAVWKGQ